MMKIWLGAVLALVFMTTTGYSADALTLRTQKEKMSYAIGVDIGNMLSKQPVDMDVDSFLKGAHDVLKKNKLLLTDQELKDILTVLQKEMVAKQEERVKAVAEKNKKDGEAFLAENKKKEGVKTVSSGLQYKVIKEGTGKVPKATDTVTVNYRGTLIDGTEFDSSYKRGQPATFPVNGVIKGWTEALQLMKTGSKWQLFVPSDLAYGDRGAGPQIGPNSVLIFEVELLSIK
jgi:FKBP-type peptidyl-prolyl cis-trans isomerase FklB